MNNIFERLDDLLLLKEGWFDNQEGVALDYEDIKWLKNKLSENYKPIVKPYVYPTMEGNIRFEWDIVKHDLSLDINLKTKKSCLYICETENIEEFDLDLELKEDWDKLNNKIENLKKALTTNND